MTNFSPSSLNRIQHEAARLCLAGQSAAARCLIDDALNDAEAFLRAALDVGEALAIVEATATARLLTETARARQFLDDDKPEPPPLPPHGGGSPFPVLFDWEAI